MEDVGGGELRITIALDEGSLCNGGAVDGDGGANIGCYEIQKYVEKIIMRCEKSKLAMSCCADTTILLF